MKLVEKPTKSKLNQEEYYFNIEADAWFKRNTVTRANANPNDASRKHFLESEKKVIEAIKKAGVEPKSVVEVGGAEGSFSNVLQKTFNCKVTMIEPSGDAVKYAAKTYPNITAKHGFASKLPVEDNSADVVVFKGVFCWVGRESLIKAVAEVDRVLKDGGYLVIKDYLPNVARKTINHHVKEREVHCFKTDHSKVFLATGLYAEAFSQIYVDWEDSFANSDMFDSRNHITVLKKSYLNYYADHNPHLKK